MQFLEDINESDPRGTDFKYDDEYISIELEIEKNFNISNTSQTQWDMVILKSENILTNYSKDLKIVSYWFYAQWKFNGWYVFLDTFEHYISFIEKYNKDLYPKKEKRKIKIFEWVENNFEDFLLEQIEKLQKNELIRLIELFDTLQNILPSVIEEAYDLLKSVRIKSNTLLNAINNKEEADSRQLQLQKEEEELRKEQEAQRLEIEKERRDEESGILEKFSSTKTQIENYNIESLDESDIDSIQSLLLPLCTELLEKAPSDYLGYKLLFSLAEILFEEVKRSSVDFLDDFVPSDDIIKVARSLENDNVSLPQLKALIEQLLIRPTWVEGYYVSSKVLYKLGKTQDALKVENMLFSFLSKNDEILKIKVRDQKLVEDNILSWIDMKLLSSIDMDNSAIEYQRAYQEVLKIKKEENTQNALMLLEEYYQKAKGEEAKYRWRLLMVDFALEIGDKKLALSLLYELERLIEAYKINLWQPSLAISVYEMLLKPLFSQELTLETKERIYSKLSILDIQKVIKL